MKKNKNFYFVLMLLVIIMTTTIVVACSDDNKEQADTLQHENIMEEYIFLAQDRYINLSVGTAEMINGLV
ncbi:MAG: hypothetical protein LBD23_05605, partial [Oscillospiraceae bacterium]|nr:hypothetical protein [Oscillospiraceae bacterium]